MHKNKNNELSSQSNESNNVSISHHSNISYSPSKTPSRAAQERVQKLSTVHHFLAGLNIKEDTSELAPNPSSDLLYMKKVSWANKETASLGAGAVVGSMQGVDYTPEDENIAGSYKNTAKASFKWNYPIWGRHEVPTLIFGNLWLKMTVKAELIISSSSTGEWIKLNGQVNEPASVTGELSVRLRAGGEDFKESTVTFLSAYNGAGSDIRWQINPADSDNRYIFVSIETPVLDDVTNYEAEVSLAVTANLVNQMIAGLNLSMPNITSGPRPDAPVTLTWVGGEGAGPLIIHWVKTEAFYEAQKISL